MPVAYFCDGPPPTIPPTVEDALPCRTMARVRFGRDQDGALRAAPPADWRFVEMPNDDTQLMLLCPSCGKIYDELHAPAAVRRRFTVLDGGGE